MRAMISFLLLIAAFTLATIIAGWWGVPVTAAIWGIATPRRASARQAAIASVLAWTALFLFDAWHAPVGQLLRILSDVFRLPAPGVIAITLIFPAALAWSATEVSATLRSRVAGP